MGRAADCDITMASKDLKTLTAQYEDPTGSQRTFDFTIDQGTSDLTQTNARTQYLEKLRAATINLQADVNQFLTQRMEADKASSSITAQDADEAKAENNYGEEEAEA